jgi:PTS system nitrogen regulatory IIA component
MPTDPATATAGALVLPELRGESRERVLAEIAGALHAAQPALDAASLARALAEREAVGSTAVGNGVALPHCRLFGLDRLCLAVALHREGVDFDAADGAPVRLFVAVLSPAEAPSAHLRLLAELARRLRDPRRIERALAARGDAELLAALDLGDAPEAV